VEILGAKILVLAEKSDSKRDIIACAGIWQFEPPQRVLPGILQSAAPRPKFGLFEFVPIISEINAA
jgi:hypothetical protein